MSHYRTVIFLFSFFPKLPQHVWTCSSLGPCVLFDKNSTVIQSTVYLMWLSVPGCLASLGLIQRTYDGSLDMRISISFIRLFLNWLAAYKTETNKKNVPTLASSHFFSSQKVRKSMCESETERESKKEHSSPSLGASGPSLPLCGSSDLVSGCLTGTWPEQRTNHTTTCEHSALPSSSSSGRNVKRHRSFRNAVVRSYSVHFH